MATQVHNTPPKRESKLKWKSSEWRELLSSKKWKKWNSPVVYKQDNGTSGYLKPKAHKQWKTLVLDLDETLIHTFFQKWPNADIVLDIEIEE